LVRDNKRHHVFITNILFTALSIDFAASEREELSPKGPSSQDSHLREEFTDWKREAGQQRVGDEVALTQDNATFIKPVDLGVS
jgi:hypothetical protein